MLNNIFLKTIYEKRWAMFWWTFTMFAFTMMIVLLFPTFRDSFGQALQNVPDSIKPILGEASDYQRLNGFLELQVFMQTIFLTFIYGIILFTGLIAGEENDGTLHTLMAQPVTRTRIYLEKLAAGAVMTWIVSMGLFFATCISAALIHEHINVWRVLQATFAQWLASLVFALVGYAIGASIGRRGGAGAIAGVYAFISYLIFTLVHTVKFLKIPNYFSPFRYLTNPRVLDNGLQWNNILVLGSACVFLAIIGLVVFNKRDVYQR